MSQNDRRLDLLVEKMLELSERLAAATGKLDHILDTHYPMLMEKLDRLADKLDKTIGKIDRVYDTMLKVLEYVSENCSGNNRSNSLLDTAFKIIQLLVLALLALVGVKIYMAG